MKKAKDVYFYTNGLTTVFDNQGKQIPELQGFIFDFFTMDKLREHCDRNTRFNYARYGETHIKCDFTWWFEKQKEKPKE